MAVDCLVPSNELVFTAFMRRVHMNTPSCEIHDFRSGKFSESSEFTRYDVFAVISRNGGGTS